MDITELLAFAVKNDASDLHLCSGLPPMVRVHGDIRKVNVQPLEHKDVLAMILDLMSDSQRKQYQEIMECDFAVDIPKLTRFRVNALMERRGASAVFRTIPSKTPTLQDIAAPESFKKFASHSRGIVLVTGPTGSGSRRRWPRWWTTATKATWGTS